MFSRMLVAACLGTAVLADNGSGCSDRALPDGEMWVDRTGADCTWYSVGSRCKDTGYSYRNVYVADEACCVCGGGLKGNETNIPATESPPTPAPLTFTPHSPQCRDRLLPGGVEWSLRWTVIHKNCAWFGLDPEHCQVDGQWVNVYSANTACCVCGGGLGASETNVPGTPAPPTPAPPTFTPHSPQCRDRLLPTGEDWHMTRGSYYNCRWFAEHPQHCAQYGTSKNVYRANEACCVCGGGLGEGETNAPATPVPPTRAPPTFTPYDPQCEDLLLPGGGEWHLHWGAYFNCAWFKYLPQNCEQWGGQANVHQGMNVDDANTACCVCGGGSVP